MLASDWSGGGILASNWLRASSTLTSLVTTGLAPGGWRSSVSGPSPGSLTDCLDKRSNEMMASIVNIISN